MKRMSKLLSLVMALCLILSVSVFASGEPSAEPAPAAAGVAPGTYTNGDNTLTINPDMTFSMNKTGTNLEGNEFVMIVTGTVTADGVFTIDGLFDGDINLIEVATPDQVAADLATVAETYAAAAGAAPSGEPSGEAAPGTYTDGVNTLIINPDMTFTMDKTGQNLEGNEFVLTVTGTVTPAGEFTITGLFDGDINLIEMATPEQQAADLASVQSAFAG